MIVRRHFSRFVALVILSSLIAPLTLVINQPAPALALRDPCALDPNNLVNNGSMGPQNDTPYGSAAEGWSPFIFDGAPPQFRWVGNEQIDPNGSQQIFSTATFDAGVQQTVRNLQPGTYYWVRWGYSLAAKSYSGPNVRVDSIGRKIGIDPTGGTDPHSPNIVWGSDYFDGRAALNIPEMTIVFAARSANATVFLRAMARDGSGGENRVWMDAICMEAKSDMPTATPQPATATPISLPPTVALRPTQKPTLKPTSAAFVPPTTKPFPTATRILTPFSLALSALPTSAPIVTVSYPAPRRVDTAVPTLHFVRPVQTASTEMSPALNADTLAGGGIASILGSFVMFAFGIVLSRWRN